MAHAADRTQTRLYTGDDRLRVSRRCSDREATTSLVSRAVGQARTGDRDALLFLYARYADDVYGYARTIVSDQDRAREVTRRAFARLERLIDRYEERDGPFPVWMRRIADSVAATDIQR